MNRAARPLDLDEIARLHTANPDPRDRALLWIGLCTGLRIGEIIRLTVGHVMRADGRILDELNLDSAVLLKRSRSRSVPVNPLLLSALNAWLLRHPRTRQESPLFPSRENPLRPLTRRHAMRLVVKCFARANLDGALSTHALRKSFAQAMHDAMGHDLAKTQLALAHQSPASTTAYLKSCNSDVRNAIRRLYLDRFQPELPLGPFSPTAEN